MAENSVGLVALNGGEISRYALARVDLAKAKTATQICQNFLPDVLGPVRFRPGTAFVENTSANLKARFLEFVFDETTKALLVLTPLIMRIMVDDVYLTRPTVTATIANGTFDSNVTSSWTNSDEAGAASTWAAGGFAVFTGTGTNYAQLDQQITCNEPGAEHAVRIVIARGPIRIKIGVSVADNSIRDETLDEGTHSLAFTPTGNFWIRVGANADVPKYLNSIVIEGSGIVELPTVWGADSLTNATGSSDIFYDQSGDVLFCAAGANQSMLQQQRIERRGSDSRSWGIAAYYADDGPFRLPNLTDVTLTPSATTGNITLTASRPTFHPGHVGTLFRLTTSGQTASANLSADATSTGNIRVSGLTNHAASGTTPAVTSTRGFAITVQGTFSGTVTLQRSLGTPGSWSDVSGEAYTTPTSKNYDDGLDNQIIYYRLTMHPWTSGTANSTLSYNGSSQQGIARVTLFTSKTVVSADVLTEMGSTTATPDWEEGKWSVYRGFPAAVGLHDGRLFWQTGLDVDGSVSDAFASFDSTVVGDSAPINRSLAVGGQDGGRWMLSLQRLIVGTASNEISIRSSAFDEPLTPTAFVARACATRGAARVRAIKVDTIGVYVERNAKRVFRLMFDLQAGDYRPKELTRLKQEMCAAGVVDVAIQRQPDTRIWFVLKDGTCAVLTYEEEDDVIAWTPFVTAGIVEAVAVLPGSDEDEVYFAIKRTINGSDTRFVERLAKRTECVGGTLSKTMDCHVVYSGAAAATVTATHLPSTEVVAWMDGAPKVTLANPITTDGSGIATLPVNASNVVMGLPYFGQIQTVKLAYGAERGTALTMLKRIARIGLVLADVTWAGVKIGRTLSLVNGLPATYKGKPLAITDVLPSWDDTPTEFNGGWDSDSRVCLAVQSPYCATVMGLAIVESVNEPFVQENSSRNSG